MQPTVRFLAITLATSFLAIATQANGAIITPSAVTASSQFAPASNLINGSGLDSFGLHDNDENNMWQSFNLTSGTSIGETVIFELDQNYNLSDAIVWQYNGPNGFGLVELDRELDEVAVGVSSGLAGAFTPIGTFNMNPAVDQTSATGEPAQIFALAGATRPKGTSLVNSSIF